MNFEGASGGGDVENHWPEGGGSGPTRPTQPEPDEPDVDPPTYPEPEIDPPVPTEPPAPPTHDPIQPYDPTVTTDPVNTTSQDYTPWLEAILNELRNEHRDLVTIGGDLISDLDSHCNHITSTISAQTGWLWTNLSAKLDWMVTALGSRMHVEASWLESSLSLDMWQVNTHLEAYLHDSFAWLADELDYQGYDDSNLRYMLLRIYQRLDDLDRTAQSAVDYTGILTTIDGHVTDLISAIDGLSVEGGDTVFNVELGQLAGFDFGSLVDLDVGKLVDFVAAFDFDDLLGIDIGKLADFVADFDGVFRISPSLDFSLTIGDMADDLSTVVSRLVSIGVTLDSILTEVEGIDPTDYSSVLASIDGNVSDVLVAIEGLDLTVPDSVDYTTILNSIEADLGLILDDWDMLFSDIGNIEGLLSEISGKLDNIGKRQPRGWDFPEPHEDPDTHEWLVPVGTREIDGHPVATYLPVKEVLRINALEEAFRELCNHFPFSMLNKLVQVAVWLTRTGVPPRFDLPVPNPADWANPLTVEVDLAPFDPVAAVARMGILLWAIVRISSRTIDMWVREG